MAAGPRFAFLHAPVARDVRSKGDDESQETERCLRDIIRCLILDKGSIANAS